MAGFDIEGFMDAATDEEPDESEQPADEEGIRQPKAII